MAKIKKREIVEYVGAVGNPPESIAFETVTVAHSLIKNKQAMQPFYDALQLLDRPVSAFVEYQRQAQKLQVKYQGADMSDKLSEELRRLATKHEAAIDAEVKRREGMTAELDKEIDVQLTPVSMAEITGSAKELLMFLSAIQPVLVADTGTDTMPAEAK